MPAHTQSGSLSTSLRSWSKERTWVCPRQLDQEVDVCAPASSGATIGRPSMEAFFGHPQEPLSGY